MFLPMKREYIEEIINWKYSEEYSIYNLENTENTIEELLNGKYYVYFKENKNEIIGFFCSGKSARIPTLEIDTYNEKYLDIGLGMKPEYCGKGLGKGFLTDIIKFIGEKYNISDFRLTVLEDNIRAIKVYEKIGFKPEKKVIHKYSKKSFIIMKYIANYDK